MENDPDYAAVLKAHNPTTRGQLDRLGAALSSIGDSASSLEDTVESIAGTVGAAIHAAGDDETLKNFYAGYAYQDDQIAAYRSLIVIAEAAGQGAQASGPRSRRSEGGGGDRSPPFGQGCVMPPDLAPGRTNAGDFA